MSGVTSQTYSALVVVRHWILAKIEQCPFLELLREQSNGVSHASIPIMKCSSEIISGAGGDKKIVIWPVVWIRYKSRGIDHSTIAILEAASSKQPIWAAAPFPTNHEDDHQDNNQTKPKTGRKQTRGPGCPSIINLNKNLQTRFSTTLLVSHSDAHISG